jgi:hypothetical protein
MNKQVDGVSLLGQTVIDIEFTPGAMMVDKVLRADATHCSTAIQVLRLLRNAIEKEAGTAIARADNMEGVIRSQWIMKFNTFNEVLDMIDMTIKSIPTENPYEHCKNFSEVCQTLFETDPQMQKFFGTKKYGK